MSFDMIKRTFCFCLSFVIVFANLVCFISAKGESNITTSKEYYFCKNNENKIALTFDDGPHPKQTYKILNILEKYGIKATFFVVGINAKNYPEPLKAVAKSGHEIGNHTFSHRYVKGKDPDRISEELESCNEIIQSICGVKPTLFRAPGGLMDEISVSNSQAFEQYDIIYWSIDTLDWDHHQPEEIASKVLSTIKSGDIVLMHDYIGYNSPTAEALELIIPELLNRGYKFVTVSELIDKKN